MQYKCSIKQIWTNLQQISACQNSPRSSEVGRKWRIKSSSWKLGVFWTLFFLPPPKGAEVVPGTTQSYIFSRNIYSYLVVNDTREIEIQWIRWQFFSLTISKKKEIPSATGLLRHVEIHPSRNDFLSDKFHYTNLSLIMISINHGIQCYFYPPS